MKSVVSFNVSTVVFLCILAVGTAQCKTPDRLNAAVADEYSVYAAALHAFVGYTSCFIIATSTIPFSQVKSNGGLTFSVDNSDLLSKDLMEDFKSTNEHSQSLGQHFPKGVDVVFLPESEHERMFSDSIDKGWRNFNHKYPGASGITYLSRVGFNQKRDTALVYVSNVRDGEVGRGAGLLLTKSNGEWKVIRRSLGWHA